MAFVQAFFPKTSTTSALTQPLNPFKSNLASVNGLSSANSVFPGRFEGMQWIYAAGEHVISKKPA